MFTKMKKYLVITTINKPNKAIQNYSNLKDWNVIVVGDKKTPKGWKMKGVEYLSPLNQEKLNFSICNKIPWNNYSRKMVGYLHAMKNGADIIAESDDDNYPCNNWGIIPQQKKFKIITGKGFVNIYKYYTNKTVWPRGFPLNNIKMVLDFNIKSQSKKVDIWQFLVNQEPDVDAIYRLTNNSKILFNKNGYHILDKEVICPFNSQNTLFFKPAFILMYLPSFVTMRATDIIRGLVAQPIMWKLNKSLGFGEATAYQDRNPHDYLRDFIDELPIYINSEKIVETIKEQELSCCNGDSSLIKAYLSLNKKNIIQEKEVDILKGWIKDVSQFI